MSDLVWFLEKSTLNPDLPYNRLLYNRFLLYRVVQLNLAKEIELFHMLSIFSMTSLKHHIQQQHSGLKTSWTSL